MSDVYVSQLMPFKSGAGFAEAATMFVMPPAPFGDGELDSLHSMADQIGIARETFSAGDAIPHYLLSRAQRNLAMRYGATELRDISLAVAAWRKVRDTA